MHLGAGRPVRLLSTLAVALLTLVISIKHVNPGVAQTSVCMPSCLSDGLTSLYSGRDNGCCVNFFQLYAVQVDPNCLCFLKEWSMDNMLGYSLACMPFSAMSMINPRAPD